MRKHKYRAISLDVWGHGPDEHEEFDCDGECEGYFVNDVHCAGKIEVDAEEHVYNEGSPSEFYRHSSSDAEIIRVLVEDGFLTPDCTADNIEIDGSDDLTLYINRKEDGKPLLQLVASVEE